MASSPGCGLTSCMLEPCSPGADCLCRLFWRRAAALSGDYRNIMNLCRVLPSGSAAKRAVDAAIDLATPVGVHPGLPHAPEAA